MQGGPLVSCLTLCLLGVEAHRRRGEECQIVRNMSHVLLMFCSLNRDSPFRSTPFGSIVVGAILRLQVLSPVANVVRQCRVREHSAYELSLLLRELLFRLLMFHLQP